tara:strand:+ start:12799 stop:14034 length:1236 start_codon:yes stop_codon:yes gene_type:complete
MSFTLVSDAAHPTEGSLYGSKSGDASLRQLLVDVSVIQQKDAGTGIQRVVRALLGALLNAKLGAYTVRPVFATRTMGYKYLNIDSISPRDECDPPTAFAEQVDAGPNDIFLALDLAAHILPKHSRQLKTWKRRGCLVVTVMYDLLPELHPGWFNAKTRRNYRNWLRAVTKLSDRIICISGDVADQLDRWVAARPWRGNRQLQIFQMRLGSDIEHSTPSRGLPGNLLSLSRKLSGQRTLLVVGTIEPRKGHKFLLPAFEVLWSEVANNDLSLVFVGRPGWKTEKLQAKLRSHPEAGERFFWFDSASDEFLSHLYAIARGVIVPSLAEGFGLPLAEAVSNGVPVLARDLSVFRSMNLANVTYFSQDEPTLLAASINAWMGAGSVARPAGNQLAPTWSDSLSDLLKCLSIEQAH